MVLEVTLVDGWDFNIGLFCAVQNIKSLLIDLEYILNKDISLAIINLLVTRMHQTTS